MTRVLLNVDAGELADEPRELLSLAHIVNIACGGHAGDEASMVRTVEACAKSGAQLSAHPSYPDRENFGRKSLDLGVGTLYASVYAQCNALRVLTRDRKLDFVKAHGALYHDVANDEAKAHAFIRAVVDALSTKLTIIGPAQGHIRDAALEAGLGYAVEGFADRGTNADGTLIPRGEPNAMIEDPAEAALRTRALMDTVQTICVHSDTTNALAIARAVRAELDR